MVVVVPFLNKLLASVTNPSTQARRPAWSAFESVLALLAERLSCSSFCLKPSASCPTGAGRCPSPDRHEDHSAAVAAPRRSLAVARLFFASTRISDFLRALLCPHSWRRRRCFLGGAWPRWPDWPTSQGGSGVFFRLAFGRHTPQRTPRFLGGRRRRRCRSFIVTCVRPFTETTALQSRLLGGAWLPVSTLPRRGTRIFSWLLSGQHRR